MPLACPNALDTLSDKAYNAPISYQEK